MRTAFLMLSIVLGGCAPSLVYAQRATATEAAPRSERALVFVLNTGLEDAQTMSSVYRHAQSAAGDGRLREVAILVYGRGIQAFDGTIRRRPTGLTASIREAMAAGVRVVLCAQAMDQMGVAREALDPLPSAVVPNVMTTLVDYVAAGAAVVRY